MNNIRNLLIKRDIESISKKIYRVFDFSWKENLCSPVLYSGKISSIAKVVMKDVFNIKCLSERQIYCISNDIVLPQQLQLALSRKEKYSSVHSFIDCGENSNLNVFDLLIIREGKILLANLSLGIFIKIYSEEYLPNSISESKDQIDNFDDSNSRLGIRSCTLNNLLFVLEPRVKGVDFSNQSFRKQQELINKLAVQHQNQSYRKFESPSVQYTAFKNFAVSSYKKLDSVHSNLFQTTVERNFSNVLSGTCRLSHRDLTAHNLLVSDEIIPIDLSPLKLGYAPCWYDTLTLMITESSEYDRHKLLINFLEGNNIDYTYCFPIFNNRTTRIDAVVFNILFMTWLPFKINLERITSWTRGYIQYLV